MQPFLYFALPKAIVAMALVHQPTVQTPVLLPGLYLIHGSICLGVTLLFANQNHGMAIRLAQAGGNDD